eukprot:g2200.t1
MSKNSSSSTKVLKFRNYRPQSDIPGAVVLADTHNSSEAFDEVGYVDQVDLSAPYKKEDSIRLGSNSANSDLKKALESRLRELEDRTKLAIYEMLTQEVAQQNL